MTDWKEEALRTALVAALPHLKHAKAERDAALKAAERTAAPFEAFRDECELIKGIFALARDTGNAHLESELFDKLLGDL